jgi:hypothetical protein
MENQMSPKMVLLSCLGGILCLQTAGGQEAESSIRLKIVPPLGSLMGDLAVAHVYIAARPANSSNNQVNAYSADLLGRLTPVLGSPYFFDDQSVSINGQELLAVNRTQTVIDAYSIAPDGELSYLTSTDWAQNNPSDCGAPAWLFPDRTGASAYAMEYDGDCANNTYRLSRPRKVAP